MAPSKVSVNKLKKEMKAFLQAPPPHIPAVSVNERNMLEWHYLIEGPPDSPYAGGWYIGKLRFPPEYPHKPPSILMLTPNGRFETNTRLCLSMSDFHPESWSPLWTVASVLTGLLSFMLEDTSTTGSIQTTEAEKQEFARRSLEWNLRNAQFRAMFPELQQVADQRGGSTSAGGGSTAADAAQPTEPSACDSEGEANGAAAQELDPDDAAALTAANQELVDGDPEGAVSRLDRRLKRHKQAPPLELVLAKAEATARIGDLQAASQLLSTWTDGSASPAAAAQGKAAAGAAAPEGQRPPPAAELARRQELLNRWQRAAACKDEGNERYRKQDYKGAVQAYKRCLDVEPDCAAVNCNMAAGLSQLGQHDAAVKFAEHALKINRSYAKAQRRLADSLAAAGRNGEAAAAYLELVKVFPGDATIKQALQKSQQAQKGT
ncbi:hypothetical protein WJX72_005955 [[Myrmecia] bisecta]|uniref:UBC core domain-containing protein n=1 Tax=[Myrmecia] bisecta TaxID=41462 RepID=A0AAW1Q166_9CHLO